MAALHGNRDVDVGGHRFAHALHRLRQSHSGLEPGGEMSSVLTVGRLRNEHWDRSQDPREAMVGGLAHSGRVIFAAGVVMVAVFLTFALSGPCPLKEMGVILGIAVLLDALLVPILCCASRAGPDWWLPRWLDRLLSDVRFGH